MQDILLYEKVPELENHFTVKFMEFYDSSYLVPHWHEHIELLYFMSGSCNFTINGRTFQVGARDLVLVNSGEIHSLIATENADYFAILIYPAFFSDVKFSSKMLLENLIHQDDIVSEYIMEMYTEYANCQDANDMVLKGIAYKLMAHLIRKYKSNHSASDSHLQKSRLERINTLIDYISAHYSEKISTADLARLCYVSEGHLCRFFRENIGKSATEYINEFRIEKASVMLTNTDESITSIALMSGFEDLNYFSRIFRKIKGKSPMEYRKLNQNA